MASAAVFLIPVGLGLIKDLTDLITQIVSGAVLILLATAAGVWYHSWSKGKKKDSPVDDVPKTFPSGVLIGNPLDGKNGIYMYRQKDAPRILEMIDAANTEVGALLVGGIFLTSLIDRDYERITKEKTLMLCLQPENSPVLKEQSRHTGSPDLSGKIRHTMERLRDEKGKITNKANLIIRSHEQYLTHSIMVFDPDNDERGCVRVVEYSSEPQDEWVTKIVFKSGNKKEYEKYLSEYRDVINNHSREVKFT